MRMVRVDTKPSTALHWAARARCRQAAQGLATLVQTGTDLYRRASQPPQPRGVVSRVAVGRGLVPPRACVSESQSEEVL